MNAYKKCTKLAAVLDTFAEKLRDPNIGIDLWETNEHTMRLLITHLLAVLNSAAELGNPLSVQEIEDEWPDVITWDSI